MSRKIDNQSAQGTSKSTVGPIPWMVCDLATRSDLILTAKFKAPESIKSMEYSRKSDVWSFGVLCWEVLAEEEPHKGLDLLETGIAIRYVR